MSDYLIAVPMRVYGVNLMSNTYVVGLPSLAGIQGFVTSLEIDSLQKGHDVSIVAWAAGFLDVTAHKSKPSLSVYTAKNKPSETDNTINASDEFKLRGNIDLILYLNVETDEDIGPYVSFLERRLEAKRLCSGSIFLSKNSPLRHDKSSHRGLSRLICRAGKGRPQFFVEDQTHTLEEPRLESLLNKIIRPKSVLYEESPDKVREIQKSVIDQVINGSEHETIAKTLLSILLSHEKEMISAFGGDDVTTLWCLKSWTSIAFSSEGKGTPLAKDLKKGLGKVDVKAGEPDQLEQADVIWQAILPLAELALSRYRNTHRDDVYEGYMVPVQIGFAAITKPENKEGLRLLSDGSAPKHCFVEPQIGMARMRAHYSVLSALLNEDEDITVYWSSHVCRDNPDRPEFYVSGQPFPAN